MNNHWEKRTKISPRLYQRQAVGDLLKRDKALLQAPTGSGKTNIAIYLMMALSKLTLVVVPKNDLVQQFHDRILEITDIAPENVVKYRGNNPHVGPITIITWQSLAAAMKDADKWQHFNHYFDCVICDEAHRTGTIDLLYTQAVAMLNCRYQYGLSATPYRSDGSTRTLIRFYGGNLVKVAIEEMYTIGALIRPQVAFVYTGFTFSTESCLNAWQRSSFSPEQMLGILKKKIGLSRSRNRLIVKHIEKTRSKCNLVLSFTTAQADELYQLDATQQKILIYGKMSKKEKREKMNYINNIENITIYTTQSFLGEGTDIPKLQNLYITTPFSGGNKTVQFAGRVLRPHKSKNSVTIYDYCDRIDFDAYNNKQQPDFDGWKIKRKKEYSKLNPEFQLERDIDVFEYQQKKLFIDN